MKRSLTKIAAFLLALTLCLGCTVFAAPNEMSVQLFGLLGLKANAETAADEDDFYYTENIDGTVSITGYKGVGGKVIVPSKIAGKKVTVIDEYAFADNYTITEISLPDGITEIGSCAFFYCPRLTKISIPDSVTIIGDYAFYYCSELKKISIPHSVTKIGAYALYDCFGLKEITIPESTISIGYNAFGATAWYNAQPDGLIYANKVAYTYKGEMQNNTSIVLKEGTKAIAESAFKECSSLTSIKLPNSVINIADEAFFECFSLTSVNIPNSVISIGDNAFSKCSSLTSVNIPNGVTNIGSNAFYSCSSLSSIKISDSVINIGSKAFDDTLWYKSQPDGVVYAGKVAYKYKGNLPDYTKLELKEGTKAIAGNAFSFCDFSTSSISIPNSVINIGDSAFAESRIKSINIPNSVISIGDNAFLDCQSLTSITIPDGVTSIGDYAFCNCIYLKSIIIPKSVTSIGKGVLNACRSLVSISVASGNKVYHSKGNCLIATKSKTLISGCKKSVIPTDGSVTSIGANAFRSCDSITSINIPNSVTKIGKQAFDSCQSLASITIPDSVISIGPEAFHFTEWYYSKPDGLIYAGKVVYKYKGEMPKNTKLVIKEGTKAIAENAFSGYDSLISISIPNSVISIGVNAFRYCSSLTSINIPMGLMSIGHYAFSGCSSLESISVASGNKIYHSDGNCLIETKTKTLVLGCKNSIIPTDGSVEHIGESAFLRCSSLTSINIPDSVKTLGAYAFKYCDLTSIIIPNSVTILGIGVFSWNNISLAIVPDSVTIIGDYAFSRCYSLKSVCIPKSITTIGDHAFYWCEKFSEVYYTGSEKDWQKVDIEYTKDYLANKNEYLTNATIHYNHTHTDSDNNGLCDVCAALASCKFGNNISWILYAGGELIVAGSGAMYDYDFESHTTQFGEFCSSINSAVISNGITNIGNYTFCSYRITEMNIPDSVTSIGEFAFWECRELKSINIPTSVTSIGNDAFSYCSSLTTINLPDRIKCIGDNAFSYCYSLTAISIPDGVTNIGNEAFISCDSLTSISIPKSVTKIDTDAFFLCGKLSDVYYTGSKKDWKNITIENGNNCLTNATIHYNHIHEWNDGVITKEPTYTSEGAKTYTCTVCGVIKTEPIEKIKLPEIDTKNVKEKDGLVYAAAKLSAESVIKAAGTGTKIFTLDGNELKTTDKVGSGMTLQKADGTKITIIVKGDNTGDGEITTMDARFALRTAVGLEKPTDWRKTASEIDGKGDVSTSDARFILRAAVGLDTLAIY